MASGVESERLSADELISTDTKGSDGAVWERMIKANILVGALVNRR